MARRDTRDAILKAAEDAGLRLGFGRVTTKEVARVAGCSEAAIYYHFKDRTDLLAEVVSRRFSDAEANLGDLELEGPTLSDRLATLSATLVRMFDGLIALSAPLVADPDILLRFRGVLEERGISPHAIQKAIASRLRREQTDGGMREDVDVHAVALMITGACHQIALERHLMGARDHDATDAHEAIGTALATGFARGELEQSRT